MANILVALRLQGLMYDQAVDAIRFQTVEVLEEVGRLDPSRPHYQLGWEKHLVAEFYTVRRHLGNSRIAAYLDTQIAKQACRVARQMLWQSRKNSRPRLDHGDPDQLFEVDIVEVVRGYLPHRLVKFGRQFNAGRAGTDDGAMKLSGRQRLALCIGAKARVYHAVVEADGLLSAIKRNRIPGGARRSKIVADVADGYDERVVAEHPWRNDLRAVLIDAGRDKHLALCGVDADNITNAVAIVVPRRVRNVLDAIACRI
jgi:hypothetical protein